MRSVLLLAALALLAACDMETGPSSEELARQQAQRNLLAVSPPMRWQHKSGSDDWTRATLVALEREGVAMMSRVPHDIQPY